jgi:predicted ATP-dependent serine protease
MLMCRACGAERHHCAPRCPKCGGAATEAVGERNEHPTSAFPESGHSRMTKEGRPRKPRSE